MGAHHANEGHWSSTKNTGGLHLWMFHYVLNFENSSSTISKIRSIKYFLFSKQNHCLRPNSMFQQPSHTNVFCFLNICVIHYVQVSSGLQGIQKQEL